MTASFRLAAGLALLLTATLTSCNMFHHERRTDISTQNLKAEDAYYNQDANPRGASASDIHRQSYDLNAAGR